MEFRLPHINLNEKVIVMFDQVENSNKIIFMLRHDNKSYNSVYHDILHIDKIRRSYVTEQELLEYSLMKRRVEWYIQNNNYFNLTGTVIHTGSSYEIEQKYSQIINNFQQVFYNIYIQKPLPEKINCITETKLVKEIVGKEVDK